MNLFLLHGKTCVQFWHKDLRIATSNSLSGHFENSGGRNWGEPKLLPASTAVKRLSMREKLRGDPRRLHRPASSCELCLLGFFKNKSCFYYIHQ